MCSNCVYGLASPVQCAGISLSFCLVCPFLFRLGVEGTRKSCEVYVVVMRLGRIFLCTLEATRCSPLRLPMAAHLALRLYLLRRIFRIAVVDNNSNYNSSTLKTRFVCVWHCDLWWTSNISEPCTFYIPSFANWLQFVGDINTRTMIDVWIM